MEIIYDRDTDTLQDAGTARYVRERGMYVPEYDDDALMLAIAESHAGMPVLVVPRTHTHARDGAGITLR